MQLKKIFWSLLVVIAILSTGVFAAYADGNDNLEFTVAFEDVTVDADGNTVVNSGDTVKVNVTISNNPGVNLFQFKLVYDTTAFEPVDADDDGVVDYESATGSDFSFYHSSYGHFVVEATEGGAINVTCVELTQNSTYEGSIITIPLKVLDTFSGDATIAVQEAQAMNVNWDDVEATGNSVGMSGHNYETEGHVIAPDCTEDGYTIFYCLDENCTASYKIDIVDALEHSMKTDKGYDATCTEDGITDKVYCDREGCGYVEVEATTIPAPGHKNDITIPAIDATCTTDGVTKGVICSVCLEYTTARETIPAPGHTSSDWNVIVEATCLGKGLKNKVCTVCDVILEEEVIVAKGHTEKTIDAVPPKCTAAGSTAGVECSVCNLVLDAPEVVQPLDHTPSDWIVKVAATCDSIGYNYKECTACKAILETETINAKGHTPSDWIVKVDATCDSIGYNYKECTACKAILEIGTIDAKGHTPSDWNVIVEATCLGEGLKNKVCTVCEVILKEEVIVAEGHTEKAIDAVAPTCTAAGSTAGVKCSVCELVLKAPEVVQPNGHTEEEIPAVEPTYSEDGSTEGKKCTVCGTITDATGVIPAKSLAWLWVLIAAVVVIGAGVAVYFFVLRKKK